jgi:hypothetical protein
MRAGRVVSTAYRRRNGNTYLGSTILRGTLRRRQFSPAFGAAFARVAVVNCSLTHLVSLASNGWVNCMRWAWW